MMVKHLGRLEYAGEDAYTEHSLPFPTWADIERQIRQLDAQRYPALTLSVYNRGHSYPCLTIIGGAGSYSAELEFGDDAGGWTGERLTHIDFDLYFSFQDTGHKTFGLGYHTYEMDEVYCSNSLELVLKLARYFAETATWHPDVPSAAA